MIPSRDHAAQGQYYPWSLLPTERHVRLLELQPAGFDAPIRCQLFTTTISSAARYEALSYVWGDQSDRVPIYIQVPDSKTSDDHEHPVTSNCFTALRRLRYEDRPRTMWIDALCIDQSNVQERSHQVTLMSNIYSQAAGVVIYLGENTTDSDIAIDYILDTDNPAEGFVLEFTKSAALIHALDHLFNWPWFHRVWVIQEVAFAVICGTRTFSRSAIQNFKYWVACTEWLGELPFVVHTVKPMFRDRMSGDCSSILRELDRARHCDATDPRDKIYALLPFLHVIEFGIDVSPDYMSSPAKVFTGFAEALVAKCGFRVLQSVQGRPAVTHLPSWVPDWTVRPTRMTMRPNWDEELKRLSTSQDQMNSLRVVQVDVEDRSRPECEGQMCMLRAYGYTVGHITKIGSAYLAGRGPFPLHVWMRLWMFSSNTWRRLLQFTFAKCRRKPDSTADDTLFSNDHTFVQQERDRFMKVISCDRWSGWYGLSFIRTWVQMEAQRNSNGSQDESWDKSVRDLARNQTGEQARDEHILSYKDIPFQNAGYCFISTARQFSKMFCAAVTHAAFS